jgi:CheY-like chemotaxis protein
VILCKFPEYYNLNSDSNVDCLRNNYGESHDCISVNSSGTQTQKKHVMICDDEPDLLEVFELTLKSEYDVISVDSGEACIANYIKEKKMGNKIDLILLDYKLRDMLGDYVARKIRSYDGTKIVLISAYDLDTKLIQELEDGNYIRKFVKKPIDMDQR